MGKKKATRDPAVSPESQEQRLINLSYQRAEEMLTNGTAPPSIITHFLKMGSSTQKTATRLQESQAALAESKASSIKQAESNKEVAEAAIEALKGYTSSSK